jgi:esterase/lipase
LDPLNKIKFVDEDGSSVVLDVPMTARGERKEVLPVEKMDEIKEVVEEKVEEEIKVIEKQVEKKVESLVNDIKDVVNTIENIKIKPPKGCCVIQ